MPIENAGEVIAALTDAHNRELRGHYEKRYELERKYEDLQELCYLWVIRREYSPGLLERIKEHLERKGA